MLPRLALTFAFAALLSPTWSSAQDQTAQFDTPAYVSAVDGRATLERDGRIESAPLNMPLLSGDRLRTSDGRVEVRFADGGRLLLDAGTSVDVLSDDLIRLLDGRVRLVEVRTGQVRYRIDSPAGSVRILQPGEYRVALLRAPSTSSATAEREPQIELAVVRGGGEIFTDSGATPVRAGERAYASAGLLPSYASSFNSANTDDFDRWAEMQRGTVYVGASQSSQYLPVDLGTYASTFDQYGDWRYQQEYGYVWYPRVAADWHPYYYGRWASYPSYGWTWIAADPFGYPTHHYGRWGISAGVWFWIPSRHWGPAYVSWGYASDYVSWCPLGWNDRAVFSIGFYNVGPRYYSGHYASAWTTVPRNAFGRGYAHQYAVNFDRGYTGARPHFSEGGTPAYDRAVPRGSAPIRYAGARSLPAGAGSRAVGTRAPGDTPRYVNRGDQIVRSQTARPVPPRDTAVSRTAPVAPPAGVPAPRQRYVWDNPGYRPSTANARPSYAPPPAAQPSYGQPAYDRPAYRQPAPQPYERTSQPYERTSPREPAAQGEARSPYQRGGYDRPAERAAPPSRAPQAAPRSEGRPSGDRAVPRAGGAPAPTGAGVERRRGGRS